MIFLVVNYHHAYTFREFLQTWGRAVAPQVRFLYYEDLLYRTSLPRGTYLFSDLERLTAQQKAQASAIADLLVAHGIPVLNRPDRVLCRYALLDTLHRSGKNRFRAVRLPRADNTLRFPVFLRAENDHDGAISARLNSLAELRAAADTAVRNGADPEALLAVEFCETADADGIYRKYSAFQIGDRFIPRHVLFSRNWITKKPDIAGETQAAEERDYLFADPHPHEAAVRAAFQTAGIDYGRIDYGFADGQLQVWEINTNPMITLPRERLAPARLDAQSQVFARICTAFQQIANPSLLTAIPPSLPRGGGRGEGLAAQGRLRLPLSASERAGGEVIRVPPALHTQFDITAADIRNLPLRQVTRWLVPRLAESSRRTRYRLRQALPWLPTRSPHRPPRAVQPDTQPRVG